ncbi:PEGA domain-containing protein [Fibrella forsythiae]|uniref:PEGA domain-containing protein n=1 Tax=Fibrella forsythiae TaxID=2817061 RepID=A0ABS3JCM4_9BACT|nr:PEGA domain-containing protein [Fibrella forsythiae]MBO0947024.1 PEGA domain-containing protein [Fibrella forsythiae]
MFTHIIEKPKISLSLLTAGIVLLGSCTSSTVITSQPAGAKLYVNGQYKGTTPYQYSDTKIVGSTTDLRLEKEGFEPFQVPLVRNERADAGAIVGGVFLLFPFLWTMKYDPDHTYQLRPLNGIDQPVSTPPASTAAPLYGVPNTPATQATSSTSKADRLREIKKLYDEKILTEKEYEAEKKKILDGND